MTEFPQGPSTETFWYSENGGFYPPVRAEMWEMFMSAFSGEPDAMTDDEYLMMFGEGRQVYK